MKKLFSRKKPSGEAGEEQASLSSGGVGLARLNLLALAVAVTVILISGYAAYLQYATLITSRQEDTHTAEAARMAAWLSGRLASLEEKMDTLAQPDPALLDMIAHFDRNDLARRETQLLLQLPSALRIRYILPTDTRPDDSLEPPLSYACLDLARTAEEGVKAPPFEAHLFGSEAQHLDLVRPVRDGDEVVASLMVTLDVALIEQWFGQLNPQGGYAELQQGRSDPLTLFSGGNRSAKQGEAFTAGVEGSSWHVAYWPSTALGVAEARAAGFLLTFAIAAGGVVAFFLFFGLFLSRFVRADMSRLINFIVDSSLGKRFHSYPVKLVEAKKALQEKENDLAVLASYTNSTESIHSKAEHFVPDITFSDGIDVEEEAPEGDEASASEAQPDDDGSKPDKG
ncbi:MAG: hypothetical protein ACQETD_10655 [Pseudomonadota bacterium]